MESTIIFENNIRKELRNIAESNNTPMDESSFDLQSYIEKRLQQYSQDHDNNFEELKRYFADNTDIEQPKNAQEEEEAYLKLLHNFLDGVGY